MHRAPGRLPGRVALVTGVTAGIGRATAARLLHAGAIVVGCARDEERLAVVTRELLGMHVLRADVRDAADRERFVRTAIERHGRVDVLVNNAGVGWEGLVEQMSRHDVERIYETNVIGLVDLTRLVLPEMVQRGVGDVLMLSSTTAWMAFPPLTVYSSSKHAVDGFVQGLRRELRGRGVRIHSINPGPVSTEWLARSLDYHSRENDPGVRPSPGIPAERVADLAVSELACGRGRTVPIPWYYGLVRVLNRQPLRPVVDVGIGLVGPQLGALGRWIAKDRTPGAVARPASRRRGLDF